MGGSCNPGSGPGTYNPEVVIATGVFVGLRGITLSNRVVFNPGPRRTYDPELQSHRASPGLNVVVEVEEGIVSEGWDSM